MTVLKMQYIQTQHWKIEDHARVKWTVICAATSTKTPFRLSTIMKRPGIFKLAAQS